MNAESLNKVYLIGTVGRTPEMRAGISGRPIAVLSLATTHTERVGTETVEVVEWHRVTAYGDLAAQLATVAKGAVISIECTLRPNKWTDAAGNAHRDTAIVLTAILWTVTPIARGAA